MHVSFFKFAASLLMMAFFSALASAQTMYPGAGYPVHQSGVMPGGAGYPVDPSALYNPAMSQGCTYPGNCTSGPCGCTSAPCGCDQCGGCCNDDCCGCGFYSGAGLYYLVPHWKTNPAYAATQGVGGVAFTEQVDFDYDAEAAPLVYAGFRSKGGFGVLGRAWWYDGSDDIELINGGNGQTLNSAGPLGLRNSSTTAGDSLSYLSSLKLDVVDLLGTYQQRYGCLSLDYGFGARYARVQQRYFHSEDPLANDLIDSINSVHTFEGVGPSFSIEGRYALTQSFKLLAGMRYSLLYGPSSQFAESFSDNVLVAQRRQTNYDVLPVFEMELGAEYTKCCGHCEFFVDAAFVAQVWEGAGNSSNNDIITVLVDPEVSDKNANLGLWGLRASFGVRF